jgi:hypothetical protein
MRHWMGERAIFRGLRWKVADNPSDACMKHFGRRQEKRVWRNAIDTFVALVFMPASAA